MIGHTPEPGDSLFKATSAAYRQLLEETPFRGATRMLERFLRFDELESVRVRAAHQAGRSSFCTELLRCLDIRYECSPDDLQKIPARGGLVVVANHPFGLAEGPVLGDILLRIRSDVKFLANSLLAAIPELHDVLLPVDPFGGPDAARANLRSVRDGICWARNGGVLVVFPAGEVSTLQMPELQFGDAPWDARAIRLIRLAGAKILPVCFHGSNSPVFHLASLVHPRLRTALLPREFLERGGSTITVSIGSAVRPEQLKHLGGDAAVSEYLRRRTQVLRSRHGTTVRCTAAPLMRWKPTVRIKAVAPPIDASLLEQEVDQLPPEDRLLEHGAHQVYCATAQCIPQCLQEIGRLREITFRAAGEGTGKALDIDPFDSHYLHLFLWHTERRQIIGAYRAAPTDRIVAQHGISGLYTTTLFRIRPPFLRSLGPALELGRSFVRPEDQRAYLPLLLLWKGIGRYVARHMQYRMLFGPVSISKDYDPVSRALMFYFLRTRPTERRLKAFVRPRKAFRHLALLNADVRILGPLLGGVQELSDVIMDLEPDHKGVPILLRQYLNVGGTLLDFSVDHDFSDVLDGLIAVDLCRVGRSVLNRYLGEEAAAAFLMWHGHEWAGDERE